MSASKTVVLGVAASLIAAAILGLSAFIWPAVGAGWDRLVLGATRLGSPWLLLIPLALLFITGFAAFIAWQVARHELNQHGYFVTDAALNDSKTYVSTKHDSISYFRTSFLTLLNSLLYPVLLAGSIWAAWAAGA